MVACFHHQNSKNANTSFSIQFLFSFFCMLGNLLSMSLMWMVPPPTVETYTSSGSKRCCALQREMQQVHMNGCRSSSSNMTTTCDWDQPVDKTSSCSSWDFSFSEKTFLVFFLLFLACVLFSCAANGFLLFLAARYKQLLGQPQSILISNMSACGVGMSLVTASAVLSSVAQKLTQTFGCWCIAQFCMLRCFFLTSQMTLALMAIERYIFICHGIHHPRIISACNIQISMGLIWLISGALSFHGGFVLSQFQCRFQKQTSGLLCNALTIKEHITFSWREGMLMFGPPSVITTFCILAICYCYGCMYRAALRVSVAIKRNNHRANRTVGFYFVMFLLQLALNMSFVILTVRAKRKASTCKTIGAIVTPLLIILPPCISAVYFIIRNPQIRQEVFSARRSPVTAEVEVFRWSRRDDEIRSKESIEEHVCEVERRARMESGNKESPSLPLYGCAFPSTPEDCSLNGQLSDVATLPGAKENAAPD